MIKQSLEQSLFFLTGKALNSDNLIFLCCMNSQAIFFRETSIENHHNLERKKGFLHYFCSGKGFDITVLNQVCPPPYYFCPSTLIFDIITVKFCDF